MLGLGQDLKYGFRMLLKNPGFTAVAVLTLALGIGANTAIFSVVNAVMLRPLPYQDPDRLVLVLERIPQAGPAPIPVSAPDVLDFAHQNRVFENVAGFQDLSYELSGIGQPTQIQAARVSARLFPLLGIEPLLGRTFTTDEDQPGRLVAVLSYSLWQGRFGADPNVIGKNVTLDRKPYTIVGVMPQKFVFPLKGMNYNESPAILWVPMAFTPEELKNRGDNFDISVVARLKRGVTLQQAGEDAATIAHRILETYPPEVRGDFKLEAALTPLGDQVVSKVKTLMAILLGAVALVLLIACANVANLLLARAAHRQKEIAVRAALGAGRFRLLRQFISESVLLALAGGLAGLLIAKWGVDALVAFSPGNIPRIGGVGLDSRVLLFTIALSLITGLAFGAAPALAASKTDLSEALKEGGRSSAVGRSHHRLRAALVVSEVAVALVLLAGAGLLIRSFQRMRETDPGFQPEHVLTMSVSLPHSSYSQAAPVRSFYRDLLERTQRLPGVRYVGISTDLPMLAGWTKIFTAEGYQPGANASLSLCKNSIVYGDYFRAMGIPLVRGRYFTDQDRQGSTPAVIISKSIADLYFAGQDPIGKRLKWGPPQSTDPWLTIAGVVGEVKHGALDVETQPHTYEPYTQEDDATVMFVTGLDIALRTGGDPGALTSAVQGQIWSLDKQLAISDIQTMTDVMQQSMAPRRFDTFLMGVFAAAALLLAAIGLYGVISYSVTQRTHEIGVRMALGAARRDVVKLVVGQGLGLSALGVAIGVAGALGLTRLISSLLYEVPATDPFTFAAVSLVLMGVAFVASYVPAHRATKVDPMVALRHE